MSGSAPPPNPHDEQRESRVRFFLEQHYHEVGAFWTRTNVFLVVMGAGLAAVVATDSGRGWLDLIVAALGLVVSLAWWRVNRVSWYYQARWIQAARGLVKGSSLEADYGKPLEVDASQSPGSRPGGPSATTMVYVVIAAFAATWLSLFAIQLVQLLCGERS